MMNLWIYVTDSDGHVSGAKFAANVKALYTAEDVAYLVYSNGDRETLFNVIGVQTR
jgi:hypothetical protein